MQNLEEVSVSVVQAFEQAINSNARIDSYGLEKLCPVREYKAFKVKLEAHDIGRLYLLGEFVKHTAGHTGLVADILPAMGYNPRVLQFTATTFDLRAAAGKELVIVTPDERTGPLVVIDGNHRVIAQQLNYHTVEGILAYVCSHARVIEWGFVPEYARRIGAE